MGGFLALVKLHQKESVCTCHLKSLMSKAVDNCAKGLSYHYFMKRRKKQNLISDQIYFFTLGYYLIGQYKFYISDKSRNIWLI